MARLVEQMLLKNRGLRVMKVESIPATPLLNVVESAVGSGPMVYRHGMNIEIKGGYLDILRYLKSLEALPWKVFWGKVTLKTEQHPVSHVSLLIYTLSTHEAWIGL
jgi:MSHA biogenesis protein MshJ